MSGSGSGRYFEDFELGQKIWHSTPRTVTEADATLYLALTGTRFLLGCSRSFARANGLAQMPLDDLLVFHLIFGKSVPDVSVNAVANLGYAEGRFTGFVYPGETLHGRSTVIGLKETSSGQTGIVWVRTRGYRDDGSPVVEYVRWVLVRKRDPASPAPLPVVPELRASFGSDELSLPEDLRLVDVNPVRTGSAVFFEDLEPGMRIDHSDGMGVMESEHRLATRLYQNTARVHFDDHAERQGRLGACIVYGGHVLSIARALSFNGLGNALRLLAINGGTHANPCVAGDTVYAWSEVLEKVTFDRSDAGAARLRLVALKNRPCADFPLRDAGGRYLPEILLDFDYWAMLPRRR
jgi:2-methylfumaryl-CoA hydratase